jgi:hypothetical protein
MLLKSPFSTTHDHTQVSTHSKQSQNSDGLFFPTPYGPDVAPSDFYLFGALKNGIDAFASRWDKAVGVGEDCVEKRGV